MQSEFKELRREIIMFASLIVAILIDDWIRWFWYGFAIALAVSHPFTIEFIDLIRKIKNPLSAGTDKR